MRRRLDYGLIDVMKVNKTAAVQKTLDALGQQQGFCEADFNSSEIHARALTLLAQLDRIPGQANLFNPPSWDDQGLPT